MEINQKSLILQLCQLNNLNFRAENVNLKIEIFWVIFSHIVNLILGQFWHNSVDKPRNQSPWPHYFMLCEKNCVLHKRLKVEKEKTIWLLMLNKATIYSLCEKKHQNFGINNNQHLSKFLGLQKTLWFKMAKKVSWINLNFSCLKWSLWILAPKCQDLFIWIFAAKMKNCHNDSFGVKIQIFLIQKAMTIRNNNFWRENSNFFKVNFQFIMIF